jgi:hypothetical protein
MMCAARARLWDFSIDVVHMATMITSLALVLLFHEVFFPHVLILTLFLTFLGILVNALICDASGFVDLKV